MIRLKTWLRRIRGAVGIGLFGSLSVTAFGLFVSILSGIFYGNMPDLVARVPELAVSGFLCGVVAAIAIAMGSRKERPTTGWAFLTGLALGATATAVLVMMVAGRPITGIEWGGIAITGLIVGFFIGILGAAAVKVAEHADVPSHEEPGRNPEQLRGPDPFEQTFESDAEAVPVATGSANDRQSG